MQNAENEEKKRKKKTRIAFAFFAYNIHVTPQYFLPLPSLKYHTASPPKQQSKTLTNPGSTSLNAANFLLQTPSISSHRSHPILYSTLPYSVPFRSIPLRSTLIHPHPYPSPLHSTSSHFIPSHPIPSRPTPNPFQVPSHDSKTFQFNAAATEPTRSHTNDESPTQLSPTSPVQFTCRAQH